MWQNGRKYDWENASAFSHPNDNCALKPPV